MVRAVLWDFGGVITTSPFESFARYEERCGLPAGFIRTLNATNHHDNAWAKLERSEVALEEFCRLYEAEATAAGGKIDARDVLACLSGDIRPEMVRALHTIKSAGLRQACLTNNFTSFDHSPARGGRTPILELFDVIVESSKIGVRKPEPEFYRRACALLAIEPSEAVFLDDLGVNLKPAREMGMTTIKVADPQVALGELEDVVGFGLR